MPIWARVVRRKPEVCKSVAGKQETCRPGRRRATVFQSTPGPAGHAKAGSAAPAVASENRSARNRIGETSSQRRLHQDEGGAPDDGVEEQRQVAPCGGSLAARRPFRSSRISTTGSAECASGPGPGLPGGTIPGSCALRRPCPPAPMATAGMPSDSGILASVDEAVQVGADSQMGVHGAHVLQDRRILGQRGGRAGADLLQLDRHLAAGGALVLHVARAVHGAVSGAPPARPSSRLLSERISTLARAVCGDGVDARCRPRSGRR